MGLSSLINFDPLPLWSKGIAKRPPITQPIELGSNAEFNDVREMKTYAMRNFRNDCNLADWFGWLKFVLLKH